MECSFHSLSKNATIIAEQVKEDLCDFEIPCSFDYIDRKSEETFNKIVKLKAKEYALRLLSSKHDTHS